MTKNAYDFLIVGAGITGLTLAERLANDGKHILVIDKKDHIGGNCYDYENEEGILIQKYGPHIFHTKEKRVFDYLQQYATFNNYRHKVISYFKGKYFPVPINRETVNLFYDIELKTEDELKEFLETIREDKKEILNSRDVVVSKFGEELYEAFVKNYTKKQWDLYPEELDKAVLERLPVRYNTVTQYFDDAYQGMPIGGFTRIMEKMANHEKIDIQLKSDFFSNRENLSYDKLIFTGRIDQFFEYKYGTLDYRCMRFELEKHSTISFQPCAVVNYTDNDVEFTRITEFKKFYFMENDTTVTCKEFPSWEGEASYPVMNKKNRDIMQQYLAEAAKLQNTWLAGRLGTYRYIDMDKAIANALDLHTELRKQYQ